MAHEAGKGDAQRPTDHDSYSSGYDRIWGNKQPPDPMEYFALGKAASQPEVAAEINKQFDEAYKRYNESREKVTCPRCQKSFWLHPTETHVHTCTPKDVQAD